MLDIKVANRIQGKEKNVIANMIPVENKERFPHGKDIRDQRMVYLRLILIIIN